VRNITAKFLLIFATLLFLGGCRTAPIYNIKDADLGNEDLSIQEVGKAIRLAGRTRGWEMKDVGEGKIRGTLRVRGKHTANVMITYNTKTFSIEYVDSENLLYDPKNNGIHKRYNRWVALLDRSIRKELKSRSR
jgi:hypothetical protein